MADILSDLNLDRSGSSEYTIALVDEVSEISERTTNVLFYAYAGELRSLRHPECCSLLILQSIEYVAGLFKMKTAPQ